MKNLTKLELKQIVKRVLANKYGFAPTLKAIVLLEATWDGEYILFEVNGHEYDYSKGKLTKKEE